LGASRCYRLFCLRRCHARHRQDPAGYLRLGRAQTDGPLEHSRLNALRHRCQGAHSGRAPAALCRRMPGYDAELHRDVHHRSDPRHHSEPARCPLPELERIQRLHQRRRMPCRSRGAGSARWRCEIKPRRLSLVAFSRAVPSRKDARSCGACRHGRCRSGSTPQGPHAGE